MNTTENIALDSRQSTLQLLLQNQHATNKITRQSTSQLKTAVLDSIINLWQYERNSND
jgi:hypothetical protein